MNCPLNRLTRFVRALLLGLMITAPVAVFAAEEGDKPRAKRGMHGDFAEREAERMARVLQLTEDQKAEWRRLREAHEESVRPLMRRMRDITERLETEADLENPDPAVVGQLELDRRTVGRQLRTARTEAHEAMTRLLDRDQAIRWEALIENGRGGPRGPFGPGGPFGRDGRGPRSRNQR